MNIFDTRIMSKRDTTANWNSNRTFVPLKGEIIIYTDRETDSEGNLIPGIKIGDGVVPAVDLPFVDVVLREKILEHIANQEVHITQQEREFWNNKINLDYNQNLETLIFNRE